VHVHWLCKGKRHPDPDNIISSLKSAFDGLQDAGVVANDRGLWPERPVISVGEGVNEVWLVVSEEKQISLTTNQPK